VPLNLDPDGSVFVVFRNKAGAPSRTLPHPVREELATVSGPWQVSFPPNWGAPPQARFDNLVSWTNYPDEGVKYFSGTATYVKDINAPQEWFKQGAKVMLDLGTVKEIAEVSINGKPVGGILWKPPFRADVKLDKLATETGRPTGELVEDAVAGFYRFIGNHSARVP
jgi:(4-O-methyl)-D-glucuronate---lignin esterase